MDFVFVGIMLIVGGGCWFLGAAGGFYAGYRKRMNEEPPAQHAA